MYIKRTNRNINKNNKKPTHTRKINPKLGFLGFLGFFGFLGFLPEMLKMTHLFTVPTPFFFFAFFGFFGFYYEGKMSNTLIDERYETNAFRASAIACKTGLQIIIGVSVLTVSIFPVTSTYTMLSLLIATIALAFGLSTFLGEYLLYRFENEE